MTEFPPGHDYLDWGFPVSELRIVADTLAERCPDGVLTKNGVGNLTILDRDGESLGYVDLGPNEAGAGRVEMWD